MDLEVAKGFKAGEAAAVRIKKTGGEDFAGLELARAGLVSTPDISA
jgi:hypothetical protein